MTTEDDTEPKEYRQHRFAPPPGATDILLVRHGESAPAREDRPFELVDGQGDPELAPEGREQAKRVAERLCNEPIDAVYVTSLRRTRETAQPLLDRLGIEATVEREFREVHLGDWESGIFRKHVSEGHPIAVQMGLQERWDVIPNAEKSEDFAARVRGAVEKIAAAHPDGRVVVFTHGGVIGQVLSLASRSRPFAFLGADNASISQIVVTGERWIVRRFNDTAHLGPLFSVEPDPLT